MRLAQYLAASASKHSPAPLPTADRNRLIELVERGIPEPTYRSPIWHRGWRIWLDRNPVWSALDWSYEHPDRDAEVDEDDRHGMAGSIEAAKSGIDQWIASTQLGWCEDCDASLHTGELTSGLCWKCSMREGEY